MKLEKAVAESVKNKPKKFQQYNSNTNEVKADIATATSSKVGSTSAENDTNMIAPPAGSEWTVIQAYQTIVEEQKAKDEELRARQKKLKFKASLDEQIKQANVIKESRGSDDKQYYDYINKDVKKWKEDEVLTHSLTHSHYHSLTLSLTHTITHSRLKSVKLFITSIRRN